MRKLILTGRIGTNAETKTTKNGKQFIEFRLANNEYIGNNNNDTYWFRITSFNQNHLKIQQYLTKGRTIEVIGNLRANAYISTATNTPEVSLDVIADDIMFDSNFSTQQNSENTNNEASAEQPQPVEAVPAPKTTKKAVAPRNPSTAPTPAPASNASDDDDLPF